MEHVMTKTACEIVRRPAQPTMVVRSLTPMEGLQAAFGASLGKVMQHLSGHGQYPAGPPFGLYRNMDMRALDVEIGFPVGLALEGSGDVKASQIPAGRYASLVHVGPYATVGKGYETLTEWVKQQGQETIEIALEFYLNDPNTVPPEQLMTQIQFALKD